MASPRDGRRSWRDSLNGRAVVTTTGHLTEPVWAERGAVALAPAIRHRIVRRQPRARCSPTTMTAPRSPRAARDLSRALCARPHDSRASRSGRRRGRMNAVRLTIGITTRNRPEALEALSQVAGVRLAPVDPKYSCSTTPRRCRHAIRCAGWSLPLTVRVLRDDRGTGLHRRAQPAGARGAPLARVAPRRRCGAPRTARRSSAALTCSRPTRGSRAVAFAQCDRARRPVGRGDAAGTEVAPRATCRRSSALRISSAATPSSPSAGIASRSCSTAKRRTSACV